MAKFKRLNVEFLNPKTQKVFSLLGSVKGMSEFTLIGGTALALQIKHRVSRDLDFAVFSRKLPVRQIDAVVEYLSTKLKVQLITDSSQISAFKINTGENLLNYVRDYVIGGVKVTFFAHGKNEKQRIYYLNAGRVYAPGLSFNVLGIDGLKTTKILVLADRVKSRDLYDLMVLIRDHGYTIDKALDTVAKFGINNDPEFYKSVMRGEIPLDKNDEGLTPAGVRVSVNTIYDFFDHAISLYETALATRFLSDVKNKRLGR